MNTKTKPRYTTRISTDGPAGNIFFVMSTATRMLRELGHSRTEIEAFARRITDASSYGAALNIVREFFPVDADDEDEDGE